MRVVGGLHVAIVLASAASFELDLGCSSAFARSNRRLVTRKRSGRLSSVDFARNPQLFEIEALGLVVCLQGFFIVHFRFRS